MSATVAGVLLTGNHASRPSSGVSAGTLYACSTHSLIYQTSDTGSTWATYYTPTAATPADAELAAIAGLTSAADKLPYFTGSGTAALADLTAAGRALIDDAAASNQRTTLGLTGTGVAADTFWDAAGDLAVGSGADTAARLALGAAGGALSRVNGAVAWNSGTSFPTAATGDRYWRTDLGMEFYYDGTRWLSVQLGSLVMHSDVTLPQAASFSVRAPYPAWSGSDIWLVAAQTWFYVVGGTALGASHKWVGVLNNQPAATTFDTVNIASGASDASRQSSLTAVGALLGSTNFYLLMQWTKTGTPGTLFALTTLTFRYVAV